MLRMNLKAFAVLAMLALGACNQGDGQRCNPLEYSNSGTAGDCAAGLSCVYPTAPNCGVAYCCTVDSTGNITDPRATCQPDPTLDSVCMLDLSSTPTVDMTMKIDMSSAD
jgi:hypothetical protein